MISVQEKLKISEDTKTELLHNYQSVISTVRFKENFAFNQLVKLIPKFVKYNYYIYFIKWKNFSD